MYFLNYAKSWHFFHITTIYLVNKPEKSMIDVSKMIRKKKILQDAAHWLLVSP